MKTSRSIQAVAILACLIFGSSSRAIAHGDEDHGAPAVAADPASSMLAIEGRGASFEGVLKFEPFLPGEQTEPTLFLLLLETNKPITGAEVKATLSEGTGSTDIMFAARKGGPAGAYTATTTIPDAKPRSWLFEVTSGDNYDLIGLSGFQARLEAVAEQGAAAHSTTHAEISPQVFAWTFAAAILLAGAAFLIGRQSARKVPA